MLALAAASASRAAETDDSAEAGIVVTGQREVYRIAQVDATRTGTAVLDTPQSISTVGRAQLDDQAVEQLNDALRYVPGVTLGQGEGHRDQVVLRGQSSTADFFLDGLRDDAQYYRPLYNTERIEVLKGANALLFGRGGGGGIVNRVSKAPVQDQTKGSGSGGIDSFGAWSLAADANLPLAESAALRLNATYESFANHRDVFGGDFVGIAPTMGLSLGETTRLTLGYEYARDHRVTDRGIPSFGGEPVGGYDKTFFGSDTLNRSTVDAHIARARLEHDLADGLTVSLAGQFARYDKFYANVLPAAAATATTVRLSGYDSTALRTNWIGQANLVWKGRTGTIGHTLLAGIEGGSQLTDSTRRNAQFAVPGGGFASTATVPLARSLTLPAIGWTGLVTNAHSNVRSLSAYVQDQVELAPFLQVIAGLRYDSFRIAAINQLNGARTGRSEAKWSPRLGLIVKPQPSVSIYASYARSFLPQSGDQFSALDPNLQTLDPEAFRNLELGAKWDLAPQLTFTAAAFQVDRTNTRVADPANPGFWLLTGRSRVRGFEVALAGKLADRWHATLGYTRQHGEIRSATSGAPAGRQLDKLPRHQLSAWTRYDVTDRLGIGLGAVHQSAQWASISNAVRLPGFTRFDAALFYDLGDRVALQLNVENLADTRYAASAHTDNNIAPGEPINARLTLRITL
jgi:catecholate siderophore receptor